MTKDDLRVITVEAAIMSLTLAHAAPIGVCLIGNTLPKLGEKHHLVYEEDSGAWLYEEDAAIAELDFGSHDPFVLSLVMEKATSAAAVVVFNGEVRDSFELQISRRSKSHG